MSLHSAAFAKTPHGTASKPVTDDVRIKEIKELVPPAHVFRESPVSSRAAEITYQARQGIHRILHGADDRLDLRVVRQQAQRPGEVTIQFGGIEPRGIDSSKVDVAARIDDFQLQRPFVENAPHHLPAQILQSCHR